MTKKQQLAVIQVICCFYVAKVTLDQRVCRLDNTAICGALLDLANRTKESVFLITISRESPLEELNIHEVLKYLPHRYPFLMIDRVTEFIEGDRIKALKNVTYNEPIFTGHFPHHPIFPGVLILEAMAQAAAILAFRSIGESPSEDTLYMFVGIDKARFRHPVGPGDQMIFDVKVLKNRRGIWQFDAICTVDKKIVCTATILITSSEIKS